MQTLKPKVPVKRMVFHEITPEAIKASLNNTRDVDAAMVDAQETRRILDRLYGYELSPVLWRKVGPGLSAGRVQSVATRLIVERERERMAFVRAPYWDVTATLEAPDADGNNVAFDSRMVSLGGRRLAGSKDFGDDGRLTAAGAKTTSCSWTKRTRMRSRDRWNMRRSPSHRWRPSRTVAVRCRRSPRPRCSRRPAIALA